MTKIACIFNIAPQYRNSIFHKMDDELGCDFIFGDTSIEGIALINASKLKGFRGYAHNIYRGSKLVWQRGAIRKAFFCKKYDTYILTGNAGILSNWVITLIAKILGRKTYLWSHGLYGNENKNTLRKNLAYLRLASHILLYEKRGGDLLASHGVKTEKMTVIYNSLDYEQQLKVRAKIGDSGFVRNYFGNDNPYVCFVGRLTKSKRLELLLEAAKETTYNIILVGEGAARAELETLAEQLSITDRVWFYGECYDQQMLGAILYHAACCVSPGNVGLTAIHSLMMGTPVITHDNLNEQMPEAGAITDNLNGLFFKQGNIEDLSRKILKYTSLQPLQRESLRAECYKVVDEKYNPQNQIRILGTLFASNMDKTTNNYHGRD